MVHSTVYCENKFFFTWKIFATYGQLVGRTCSNLKYGRSGARAFRTRSAEGSFFLLFNKSGSLSRATCSAHLRAPRKTSSSQASTKSSWSSLIISSVDRLKIFKKIIVCKLILGSFTLKISYVLRVPARESSTKFALIKAIEWRDM